MQQQQQQQERNSIQQKDNWNFWGQGSFELLLNLPNVTVLKQTFYLKIKITENSCLTWRILKLIYKITSKAKLYVGKNLTHNLVTLN